LAAAVTSVAPNVKESLIEQATKEGLAAPAEAENSSEKSQLLAWDLSTKSDPVEFAAISDRTGSSLTFSPDGRLLAVHGPNDAVTVYEIATRKQAARFATGNSSSLRSCRHDAGGQAAIPIGLYAGGSGL
jgi:hypothetical protein